MSRTNDSMKVLTTLMEAPQTPLERPEEKDWGIAEKELGFELPGDYKEFIDRYGTGTIDNFLWILNPFSKNKHLNLFSKREIVLHSLRQLQFETIPYRIDPESPEILPWAITDNGDILYWHCVGQPSNWSIVINESRGPRWREYQFTTVEFLTRIIKRDLIIDLFPDDFPSDSLRFSYIDESLL